MERGREFALPFEWRTFSNNGTLIFRPRQCTRRVTLVAWSVAPDTTPRSHSPAHESFQLSSEVDTNRDRLGGEGEGEDQ